MLRGVDFENTLDAEVKVVILPRGKDPDDVIKEDAEAWQQLLAEALPVVDYTFNMVASGLDLTTAKGKSLAVDKLLPIIAEIKDPIRQAHYSAETGSPAPGQRTQHGSRSKPTQNQAQERAAGRAKTRGSGTAATHSCPALLRNTAWRYSCSTRSLRARMKGFRPNTSKIAKTAKSLLPGSEVLK